MMLLQLLEELLTNSKLLAWRFVTCLSFLPHQITNFSWHFILFFGSCSTACAIYVFLEGTSKITISTNSEIYEKVRQLVLFEIYRSGIL